jgi:hypothetical protein
VHAADLYFSDTESGTIRRYNTLTAEITPIIPRGPGISTPMAIEIDRSVGKLFWVDANSHQVRRANLDGTAIENLFTSTATTFGPLDLSLDRAANRIYWTDEGTGQIFSSNYDGSDRQTIIMGLDDPAAIAVHSMERKFYWTDDTQTIRRANLDGTNVETVLSTFGAADIVLDETAGKIYFTAGFQILRANLDGSSIESLNDGRFDRNFYALALDLLEDKVYWSDVLSSARIGRMNLDGQNKETLITGAQVDPSSIRGLAVDPIPEPSTLLLLMATLALVIGWPRLLGQRGRRLT